jgi:hypothetical protein
MASVTDYVNTHFEFPVLTKIHGEPTFDSVTTLQEQVMANATTVVPDLGGGAHGHLGAVLNPVDYALIPNIAYVRTPHSGALNIPAGTSLHETIRLKEERKDNIALYRSGLDVERALIKQIVAAIDQDYLQELRDDMTNITQTIQEIFTHLIDQEYLQELRDDVTNTITQTIQEIFTHLITCYGDVDPMSLMKWEDKVRNLIWNINDPPVNMFNKIEYLIKLAKAAQMPKTQAQIANLGLAVRTWSRKRTALLTWYGRPVLEHTWVNIKAHFTAAQRQLKQIRGITIQSTPYYQVNQIAAQLSEDFTRLRTDVVNSVTDLVCYESSAANLLRINTCRVVWCRCGNCATMVARCFRQRKFVGMEK